MKKTLILIIFLLIPVLCFGDSFEKIKTKALSGDAFAQLLLGEMYATGQGVTQDFKETFRWYLKSAESGNARAKVRLGALYSLGLGVKQDYKEAFRWYLKSAKQGDAQGQLRLGDMYDAGLIVTRNDKKAFKWYLKSAEQGYAQGQLNLGRMYAVGRGVPQDGKEAFKWILKSAKQGDVQGQLSLGRMYATGRGVTRNDKKAYVWYNLTVLNGFNEGQKNIDIINKKMTKEQISEAKNLTKKIFKSGDYSSLELPFGDIEVVSTQTFECAFIQEKYASGKPNKATCSMYPEKVFSSRYRKPSRGDHCEVDEVYMYEDLKDVIIDIKAGTVKWTRESGLIEEAKVKQKKYYMEEGESEEEAEKRVINVRNSKEIYSIKAYYMSEQEISLYEAVKTLSPPYQVPTHNLIFGDDMFLSYMYIDESSGQATILEPVRSQGTSWVKMRFGKCKKQI